MKQSAETVFDVTVIKDGRKIKVYKLKNESGRYNIYLGDSITIEKVSKQEHTETFDEKELKF